jgi:L-malate glycosyltransferase
MHIGIVSPCSSGPLSDLLFDGRGGDLGCGVHFMATLVRALIERGHLVSVVTLSADIDKRAILRGRNLNYYVYPMRTRHRMRDLYRVERQGLQEGISLARPDVLHAHWTYEFALACLGTGMPTVVTIHDNAFQVLRFYRDLYRLGRLYLQIHVIRRAPWLTAVSPYLANSLSRLSKSPIRVIPNPITIPKLKQLVDPGLGNVKIATVLNGWSHLKNAQAAIRAFALLRRQLPDSQLYMYGVDFEPGGIAERWALSKCLHANIRFCGFLPHSELLAALSEMSLLLHPSLEESFGMALVEAMALGLPVIGGAGSGGVPWVLDGGGAGFLADVGNPERIATTLMNCIYNTVDRQQRQNAAYERLVHCFAPGAVAEEYESTYTDALSV